jgi:hypothetical protein
MKMLKQEYYDALVGFGHPEEELEGLKKDALVRIYDDYLDQMDASIAAIPEPEEPRMIVSKRKTEYWLADGSKIPFSKVGIPRGALAPLYKAGDILP